MATITVTPTAVQVRFTRFEKLLGLVRDRDFGLDSVVSARVEQNGLDAVRGLRAPGLGLPGLRLVGTWRGRGRGLVSVRRGQPAVVVELTGQRHDRLVIGTPDAQAVADRISSHLAER